MQTTTLTTHGTDGQHTIAITIPTGTRSPKADSFIPTMLEELRLLNADMEKLKAGLNTLSGWQIHSVLSQAQSISDMLAYLHRDMTAELVLEGVI